MFDYHQASDLQRLIADEVRRRGVEAVARRLTISAASLNAFLGGEEDPRLLSALGQVNIRYADLEQFLSSYFYQGYDAETGSVTAWEPAATNFIDLESRKTILGTIEDLRSLLGEQLSDEDLTKELWNLGSRFAVNRAGYTPSAWLKSLVERLEREIGSDR